MLNFSEINEEIENSDTNNELLTVNKNKNDNNDAMDSVIELFDGEMINKDDSKVTNITFEKIDFNLSRYETY